MRIKSDNDVSLRSVELSDAQFILQLRLNPELGAYLSTTANNIEMQREFIEKCKLKELQKLEYYFIIEYQNVPVGTVRLYNIDYEKSTFTWGSWIVQRGNPGNVALSSAYMTYHFGFNNLNLQKALIDVRKENASVLKFHNTYCDFLYEDEIDCYLEFKKENFHKFTDKFQGKIPTKVMIAI